MRASDELRSRVSKPPWACLCCDHHDPLTAHPGSRCLSPPERGLQPWGLCDSAELALGRACESGVWCQGPPRTHSHTSWAEISFNRQGLLPAQPPHFFPLGSLTLNSASLKSPLRVGDDCLALQLSLGPGRVSVLPASLGQRGIRGPLGALPFGVTRLSHGPVYPVGVWLGSPQRSPADVWVKITQLSLKCLGVKYHLQKESSLEICNVCG